MGQDESKFLKVINVQYEARVPTKHYITHTHYISNNTFYYTKSLYCYYHLYVQKKISLRYVKEHQ